MDERRMINGIEERRAHERLSVLEDTVKTHLVEHTQFVAVLTSGIKNVETASERMALSMSEIASVLKIYNNTRGFIATIKIVGATIFWIAAIGASLAAIGAAIKFWIKA